MYKTRALEEFVVGWHEMKSMAYDGEGNKIEDKIKVVIFN